MQGLGCQLITKLVAKKSPITLVIRQIPVFRAMRCRKPCFRSVSYLYSDGNFSSDEGGGASSSGRLVAFLAPHLFCAKFE